MRGVRNMMMSIIGAVLLSVVPGVYAEESGDSSTYETGAEFKLNGMVANSLEGALSDFLMKSEVQQFAFAIYQQGKSYGGAGQEWVSSSPEQDFADRHIAAFCSANIPAEKTAFGCKATKGLDNPDDEKYVELGDIKFSVLLEPDVYTADTSFFAANLIKNVVTPFPTSKFADSAASLKNDAQKKEEYATYLANQATLGVALYSLNEMYGMRVPGAQMGVTNPLAMTKSVMSVMEEGATKRFLDPTEFMEFLEDPTTDFTAVLKEMATMQAFSLWMQYQSFRQAERAESLQAALLAYQLRSVEGQNEMINSAADSTE